ncbi:peptidylprolyl isomerase [Sphingomonas guangdongensis]|uniref:peptidylprolyl isomerase n=1 Tax=Sphingomonas guangdongensis TaxID=1141890 RepID=A0A285QD05_9SPHN|nr:peptidylprolyl isomerase [Sphingomonas guangdongensis]SOB79408.1 peptidylprolyl isomerase [Sphingomonas guangdongensis]
MLLSLLLSVQAAPPAAAPPKPYDAEPADWVAIPDDEMLVFTLADGRRVVVRLAARYAPAHVANMRALATARWWDGESVYRVQDNYVTQWGDPTEKKALPSGLIANPPAEYEWPAFDAVATLAKPDSYSTRAGYSRDGWPLATNGTTAWMPHCYGMVGVARDLAPSTGSGGDLYAVIGHGPRHLDRNIAVVGRVIEGMEALSSFPRGTGNLGFYEQPAQYVRIRSGRLASTLPAAERPRYQYRRTDNARFAAWIAARENREPPFFTMPAGGADICNAMPPVRKAS